MLYKTTVGRRVTVYLHSFVAIRIENTRING